jgi:predicted dinucleotide-binding enzyme
MKIGVIGSGKIGSTVGALWVKAGHDVMFAARRPQTVEALVLRLGDRAQAGTPEEAAFFGEVVFFAIPFAAWPDLVRKLTPQLVGKVAIDAANPYRARDGAVVDLVERLGRGSGAFVAGLIPAAHVVKAFNTLYYVTLAEQAHRSGERLAVPVAGNNAQAVAEVAGLVRDAGFEPVTFSSIERAREFDSGTPVYDKPMSARELRSLLGVPPDRGLETQPFATSK